MEGRLDRVGRLLGWGLLPLVVVMEFFDLRRGLHGRPAVVSAYLIGFGILTLALLVWSVRRWREVARPMRWMALLFAVLVAMSLVSALTIELPVVQRERIQITREVVVVPLLTALLTLTASISLVLASPRDQRRRVVWWAGWVVLVCSLVNWPRAVMVHRSLRISTGMGGSAIYHVVLLTTAAMFLGHALQGWHRRWSAAGAAICLLGVVAVGSRAGLACLATFAALTGLWAVRRGLGRSFGRWALGGVVALVVALVTVPSLRRLLVLGDSGRATNLTTAWSAWTESWQSVLFGVGSGRLWPWYALDVQLVRAPGGNLIITDWGKVLTSPHSLYLAVLVELGILGAVLLVAMLAAIPWSLRQQWGTQDDPVATMVLIALAASLLAFVFDTYLLKNFGVSFWWWVMALGVVGSGGVQRTRGSVSTTPT
ncbi:O-antigen ligase family protein [Aestuariimicrobium ganziense]|uniref:O-antigen ligase family protein n=1 Tax=Aestuariimicrobium ganziense TaxID=2773677 RepID=UPI001941E540|nr:hypothetical protein [Aestuariimicrobium ganziense]